VAVDAMGGDKAPGEIVDGALQAAADLDIGVLLVGRKDAIDPLLRTNGTPVSGVEVEHAADVVAMDEDPASAARRKKDSSLVRCAQAVRDGRAQAMVGAGNTGATMAAALLRMGRIRGIARPAIAVPIPVPAGVRHQLLIDGGSTVDCTPEWLAQFARMGREYARTRLAVDEPTVGLLSNGEEPGKVLAPLLLEAADVLDPESTGGAVLLGVDGVCVISHGSSSARAIVNALRVAKECVDTGVVRRLKEAIHAG
jgi:glycerol-3-phosphate acyltransferase PlsX